MQQQLTAGWQGSVSTLAEIGTKGYDERKGWGGCLAVFLIPVVIAESGTILAAELGECGGHTIKALQPNLFCQHPESHLRCLAHLLICLLVCEPHKM